MKFPKLNGAAFLAMLSLMTFSCSDSIYEGREKDKTDKAFAAKAEFYSLRLPDGMSSVEREALEFMYAYMPASDVIDYSADYHLENVRMALKARDEMPWGKDVPAREFRHFVLPYRVNNENLDSSRAVFYEELKDRVSGMTMEEAVLEINHWCHEKVVYQPTDSRTCSPSACVKAAFGRCGEESTFTVAALRSVGIPARQVYTPRWAHTDDNHAWVEAWVDGRWRFFGACEPEPVLDLGWFNAPAGRAMLMHTVVFGDYDGPEDVMKRNMNLTEINVIDNYVETSRVSVTVKDTDGKPVPGALVEFKIYNYAEFFTVKSEKTGEDATSSLTAGHGDLFVWASEGDRFGFSVVSFREDASVDIVLDRKIGEEFTVDLNIVPPAEISNVPEVSEEMRKTNDRRLLAEDSIRTAYTSTFYDRKRGIDFARAYLVSAEENKERVADILVGARGNSGVIEEFLKEVCFNPVSVDNKTFMSRSNVNGERLALDLLEVISEKDRRDVGIAVLRENYSFGQKYSGLEQGHLCRTIEDYRHIHGIDGIWKEYVLSPRVSNEALTLWRDTIPMMFGKKRSEEMAADPGLLAKWCRDSIIMVDAYNTQRVVISQSGICRTRMADMKSLKIFFVSAMRSFGVPSRLNPVTAEVEYMDMNGNWNVVDLADATYSQPETAVLGATYGGSIPEDPKYGTHYTISEVTSSAAGEPALKLMTFPDGDAGSWSRILKDGSPLPLGYYMITTGMRMASGSVLARVQFIELDRDSQFAMVMRHSEGGLEVIGSFDSESRFTNAETGEETSVLLTSGRGYYVVVCLGVGEEPTNHVIKDLTAAAPELEKWGRSIIFLFPDMASYRRFVAEGHEGLPSNVVYGIDNGGKILESVRKSFRTNASLPAVIVGDTFNRVVYFTMGYTIGTGSRLVETVSAV